MASKRDIAVLNCHFYFDIVKVVKCRFFFFEAAKVELGVVDVIKDTVLAAQDAYLADNPTQHLHHLSADVAALWPKIDHTPAGSYTFADPLGLQGPFKILNEILRCFQANR